MDTPSESEDCLYLNVTTPRSAARTPRPVMVWLHGGDFRFGSGDGYGGQRLATGGDVVVVTVNYRLGALGFLAHPALAGRDGITGNFGLQDQQAALRWVRRNAAAFGGDPGNVTVFGQSAGATSVCAQLAAPASAGLFHRAIMQSNSCANPVQTRAEAIGAAQEFARRIGCTDPAVVAACLRGRYPARLVETVGYPGAGVDLGPVVDGRTLPVDPAYALTTGRLHPVPVLTGMNRDESRLVVWGMERIGLNCPEPPKPDQEPESCPLTDDQYRDQVRAMFGDHAGEVLARYPRDPAHPASETLGAVLTDHDYAEPVYSAAMAFARRVPTFAYEFADEDAPFFTEGPEPTFASRRVPLRRAAVPVHCRLRRGAHAHPAAALRRDGPDLERLRPDGSGGLASTAPSRLRTCGCSPVAADRAGRTSRRPTRTTSGGRSAADAVTGATSGPTSGGPGPLTGPDPSGR